MAILPLRCGNSNRADLQLIADSLLAQRGDAITKDVGSIIWIETQAWARAIYHIWAVNQKMYYQRDPNKMTDFLERWESIMGLAALPTDSIQDRQARLAARFALINKSPNTQNVTFLLEGALAETFLNVINDPAPEAYAQFPGGVPITGGITNIVDAPWYSSCQQIFIEVTHPSYMTDNQFYNTVNQIFPLLNNYLPAYTSFSWFWNGFSDDGYGSSTDRGLLTATVGDVNLFGFNTAWATPINPLDGAFNINPGSILECYDDTGTWQRLVVDSVVDDTHIILTEPVTNNITSKIYVIQGFFLDCDPNEFPFPPAGCKNLDNAGISES